MHENHTFLVLIKYTLVFHVPEHISHTTHCRVNPIDTVKLIYSINVVAGPITTLVLFSSVYILACT